MNRRSAANDGARPTRVVKQAAMRLLLLWIAFFFGAPRPALARSSDVVVLRNGDRISGEIKGLERGKLDFSTDDAGRLSIEWEKVESLTSPFAYDVEVGSGLTYFGHLVRAERDGYIVVQDLTADTLRISSVVGITTLDAGFLQRVKSYLDLGFTLAKAHKATTFSLGGSADYRAAEFGSVTKFDAYAQGQEEVATTVRNSVRQSFSWFLPERWSLVGLAQFEHNDELSLDHRWTYGGALDRVLQHSNRSQLVVGAGLVGIQEQFSSSAGGTTESSVEALAVLNWDAYRFDTPKLDLSTATAIFPSLSDAGRVRGQIEARIKYELFKDFNVGAQFTDNFDSRPPEADVAKNDYITTLTIGWSYRR
jgi:hypothetical protein